MHSDQISRLADFQAEKQPVNRARAKCRLAGFYLFA